MAKNGVEARVEAQVNESFVDWLYEQVRENDLVAAPDGECEAYGFGAVNLLPGAVLVPWGQFEDNPGGALWRLFALGCRELAPAVVAQYDRRDDVVSLRWGRHVPTARALPGAVLLG